MPAPPLTVNRGFMAAFLDQDAPCLAPAIVETQGSRCALIALRLSEPVPRAISGTGFEFGRRGECWSSASSADRTFELFIRADIDEPTAVLAVLTKELVHAVLPTNAGHGALFKRAALKLGLEGPMRSAMPGVLLRARLAQIAEALGPLPHARLDIGQLPLTAIALDRPKKQQARMLKAGCQGSGCGYVVRIAAKWVHDLGAPLCPRHGAMIVDDPKPMQDGALEEAPSESV